MSMTFEAPPLMRSEDASATTRGRWPRLRRVGRVMWRSAPTAAFVWLCVVLGGERLTEIAWRDVSKALDAIPLGSLALAFGLAAMSHMALACYDFLAFRRLGRRVPWTRALKGGFAAGSFAQTLGLGALTATGARLRIYRANDVTPGSALALTGLAALGFFSGVAVFLSCLAVVDPGPAALMSGAPPESVRALSIAFLIAAIVGARWAGRRRPKLRLGAQEIEAPGLGWLVAATVLTAADLLPAALCFWALLPEGAAPDLYAFVAIFVAATAIGLLSGSPGAVGPFEAVIFLAMPAVPAAGLAAAALAFRAIYYLPGFAVAAILVIRARPAPSTPILEQEGLGDRIAWTIDVADRAEAELATLGDKHVYMPAAGGALAQFGITGRVWLMMGEPVGPRADWPWLIDGLEAEARAAGASLAVYKASEEAREFWEERGYRLWPLGEEGCLDPGAFTLDGPEHRELRRKIRKAEKSGVVIRLHEPTEAPLDELAEVAEAWREAHGGREQGFSMGVWSPEFVRRHPVIAASVDGRPVAFVSLWVSGDGQEWMLDLMRQRKDAPNGTMHALIAAAIRVASERGARRFNLCMAPLSGLDRHAPTTLWSRLADFAYRRFDPWHGLTGMRRFKEIFRPDWTPRHLAAPGALTAAEALLAARSLVAGAVDPDVWETSRTPVLRLPDATEPVIWEEEDLDALARSVAAGRDVA